MYPANRLLRPRPLFPHDGWIGRGVNGCHGVNRLKPGTYQQQIGRAGRQQAHGKREVHALAAGMEDRSHPENIRRF
jgi:hypothetical protein